MKFKVNKTKDYTVISNGHLKEKNMSLKAKGLLTLMLALPDEWKYSIGGLCELCLEGENAIKNALDELKQFGYLVIDKKTPDKTESKKIEYEYNIYEYPQKQGGGFQVLDNQGVDNQGVDKQGLENQGLLNTNISNTNILNTNKSLLVTAEELDKWFDATYKLYPRKVSKIQAKTTYEHKLRGLDKETAYEKSKSIYTTLKKQICIWQKEDRRLEYVPHLASWLNNNIEDSPFFKGNKAL